MKLCHVQFITTVSFGGSLQSASNRPVGDRPGQGAMDIELNPDTGCIYLTKSVNGRPQTRIVPMSNVAAFELLEEPPKAATKK